MLKTDVGQMLKMVIKEKKVKNADLAKTVGMSKTFLSGYLNGFSKPHYVSKSLLSIADALGYDVEVKLVEKKEKRFIMTKEFIDSARNIYANVRRLSNNDGDKCVEVLKVMQDIEVEALLGLKGLTKVEEDYIRKRCEESAKARGEEAPADAYGYIGKDNLTPPKAIVDEFANKVYDFEEEEDDDFAPVMIDDIEKKKDTKKRK